MTETHNPVTALSSLRRGEGTLFSAWCSLREPAVAGVLAREAFDAVILDMQHGLYDVASAVTAIQFVAAAGKPAVVRIPVGEFATASRLLDAGAAGIIAPMINTVEDAWRFSAFTKYPPIGERSWGPHGGLALTGLQPADYFRQANGFSLALAMIETREALDLVDEILAVPGIDGAFIGPADLSIGLSHGETLDPLGPAVDHALHRIVGHARAAGKIASVFAHNPERAALFAQMGYSLIAVGTDAMLLRAGAQAALKTARGAPPKPGPAPY